MLKAYFWLTFCVIVWGSNFVFGKMLVQHFSPALLTSLRLLFIVIILLGITSFKKQFNRVNRADILFLIALGVIGVYINQWTFFVGLQTADPTTSALILATTPILTSFLAAVLLKEKLTFHMFIGSIVAIIGIYFIVAKGSLSSLRIDVGLIWIVVTMITFAIMIIITRVLSQRIAPLNITLYSNVIGFIVSLPFAFILDAELRISANIADWSLLIATAVVIHGVAALIWNQNIRHVNASKASILSNLEPFVAMVLGLILLSKPITAVEIIGSLFIVGGVMLSTYQR